jgi:hypothetical protein
MCQAEIYGGSRFIDPEPPETCENDALEGSDYCEEHADE